MSSNIQAILFDRELWDPVRAFNWLNEHNLRSMEKFHVTKKKIRFRMADPSGFSRLRTKNIGHGIQFVFGFY